MLEKVYFELEDNVELVGLLYAPEVKTDEVVISIHGMQSNCLKRRSDILAGIINKANISYFEFDNRGANLMCYTKKTDGTKVLNGGSVYEDVLECYYDIKGAIDKMISLGYAKIHLQGHSLGCTKIVYAYNKLKDEKYESLDKIKSIILLSLVDLVGIQKYDLGLKKYNETLAFAIAKEKENKTMELMPFDSFDHPISVKAYLRYFRDNEKIDFAKFSDASYDFKELNNITIPLFLRWGENDLVVQPLDELIDLLKQKIHNKTLNIGYIKGTDHGYSGKEDILGKEIVDFIQN